MMRANATTLFKQIKKYIFNVDILPGENDATGQTDPCLKIFYI